MSKEHVSGMKRNNILNVGYVNFRFKRLISSSYDKHQVTEEDPGDEGFKFKDLVWSLKSY